VATHEQILEGRRGSPTIRDQSFHSRSFLEEVVPECLLRRDPLLVEQLEHLTEEIGGRGVPCEVVLPRSVPPRGQHPAKAAQVDGAAPLRSKEPLSVLKRGD
jgi:hypothetical protein